MKQIKYIYWVLLFLTIGFTSCDKNEAENIDATENINVPEGYMKVSFPGEESAETRAVNGYDSRIGHLQYLLYKKDTDGKFKLDKANSKTVFEGKLNSNTQWPLKTPVYCFLPINQTYKIVFLGNIDKSIFPKQMTELLENVADGDLYENARILSPSVNFSSGNMYHSGVAEFATDPAIYTSGKMNVNILLKRIVSRNILTREGIDNTEDLKNESGYIRAYFANILRKGKPLGEQVFYGVNGALANQLYAYLLKDLVFPTAYVLDTYGYLNRAPQVAAWYATNKDTYIANYDNWNQIKGDLDKQEAQFKYNSDNFLPYLAELIEKIYTKDTAVLTAIIEYIINADLPDPTITLEPAKNKSFTLLKKAMVTSLYNALGNGTNSPLTPWYKFLGITVNQGKVPVSIDFDLNNVKYTTEDIGERKYSLTLGSNGADKSVEIITLGGQDSNEAAIFGFSALTLDEGSNTYSIPLPATFTGTAFKPNYSHTYKLVPDNIALGTLLLPAAGNTNKLFFRYDTIWNGVQTVFPASGEVLRSVPWRIVVILYCVHNEEWKLNQGIRPELVDATYSAEIVTPDFSNSNMTVTMRWQEE